MSSLLSTEKLTVRRWVLSRWWPSQAGISPNRNKLANFLQQQIGEVLATNLLPTIR